MEFLKMVNSEHQFGELMKAAEQDSYLAKARTANSRIIRVNHALIKVSVVLASALMLVMVIK